jgi:hypothetical protein
MPAGSLEGRQKIPLHAELARLAMIQKKTVHTPHPVVVQILYDRYTKLISEFVDGRRKRRKDIVDEPAVVAPQLLVLFQHT